MYVQKGFISNTLFVNNTPANTAMLGELSPQSTTYSREKGYYGDNTVAPNLLLTSFISKDGSTNIAIPPLIAKQIIEVAGYVYNLTLNGQVDIGATMLLENLLTSYTGVASDFECGEMITDNVHTLPEWLSWKSSADPARPDNFIKIWFTDESFSQQYDEFEIYVVPPMDVLDNFFLTGSQVETALKALSSVEKTDRIQAAKEGYPETVVRTNTYDYIDPLNALHIVPSDWTVLIYGLAGDNVDSIKDALMEYILSHSSHGRDDWIKILPDIFKRTEFIVIPDWGSYAISNRELVKGIHSPQVNLIEANALIKKYATMYPLPHIDTHASTMGHPYRSLALMSIGSPDNRNNQYRLRDVFPDLIAVTSTSPDFNRMSKNTQDWASMLAVMLVEAEKMTRFTTIPQGMMKMVRDNVLYLTKSYKNINYLVVAKTNFPVT